MRGKKYPMPGRGPKVVVRARRGVRVVSKSLLNKVLSNPSLPTLPAVAAELLELTSNPDIGMAEVARVVEKDPALSGKVVKTINSSFYALKEPCGSISRALAYLGMNTVKSLVLGFSLVDTLDGVDDGFDLSDHWRRAIYSATSARILGGLVPEVDADEAFTAALFQDIGAIAMFVTLKKAYVDAVGGLPHDAHADAEEAAFGFDHQSVGEALTRKWNLPESIVECVRQHHRPGKAEGAHAKLVKAMGLGVACAEAMVPELDVDKSRLVTSSARQWFGIQPEAITGRLHEIEEHARTLAAMFGQDIGAPTDVETLMEQAQERTLEHQVEMQRETARMTEQAYTDALTGAHNRKKFDEALERAFADHQKTGDALGLLFLDADRFKSVNDTHGHGAGDAVLVELARRTADAVGDRGMVCRYGGEEFAVLLPGCGRGVATEIAEEVRAAVEAAPFDVRDADCEPDELAVTVSVGVSATDCADPARLTGPERLVQEADKGVYAAKDSGRNAVRVWGHLRTQDELDDVADEAPAVAEGKQPKKTAGKSSDSVRVLVIEDDELAAVLIRTVLCQRRGVSVECIASIGEFVQIVSGTPRGEAFPYDVILTDHRIQGGTGIAPVQLARHNDATRDIPVFVLTGSSDPRGRAEYTEAGATAFIEKDDFVRNMKGWVTRIVESSIDDQARAA